MSELKPGAFDKWYCIKCKKKFERNIKFKSVPKCPDCGSRKLSYTGQVAR